MTESRMTDAFNPQLRAIVEAFRSEAEPDLRDRVQKLALINEISLAISSTLELEPLLTLILKHALSVTGAEQAYLIQGEQMHCLASLDRNGLPVAELNVSRSILARCMQERKTICITDTLEHEEDQTRSIMALELRSVMGAPLLANQQLVGVLYLSSRAIAKSFTPQDQAILEGIASQAALAIRNAQLLKEQERQILELEQALTLVQEAQLRAMTDGLTGLYNRVFFDEHLLGSVHEAKRYGQLLALLLIDLDHFKQINDTHGHQTGDEVLRQVSTLLRRMVRDCDIVARYGGEELAILLPHTDKMGASIVAHRIREAISELPIISMAGLPVKVTASIGVAAFSAGLTASELLERTDKALYLAKHSGRNQVFYDGQTIEMGLAEVQELRSGQYDAMMRSLHLLADMAENHCALPAGYLLDKLPLLQRLAEVLRLPPFPRKELEEAFLLHDLGMVAVPQVLLAKPGALDAREWELVRTHASQGARLLLGANLPRHAEAVRHHHERWDGSGYPDGLKGEAIPLASRILAVIDTYAALLSDRPYRQALSGDAALEEMRHGAGTQFDPRVLDAFLSVLPERE